MNLVQILLSQAVRLGKVSGKGGGNVYGLNLTKLCEQRYGFLQAPKTLEEYNLTKGVTFLHGYFQERFVIDRFQVFQNGLLVEAKVDTDECDEFLDDVTSWAIELGGFTFATDPKAPRIFLSNIEVQSSISLASSLKTVSVLGKDIARIMRGYGHITPDWELSGLAFGNGGPADAASFKFERREGVDVPPEIFFATARMRTKDHLSVLGGLETLLS